MQVRYEDCVGIYRGVLSLASWCDLSLTEDQHNVKYIHGLNYPIQESIAIQDVFSVDEARNKAMKIERLRSRAPPFTRPLSIEEP